MRKKTFLFSNFLQTPNQTGWGTVGCGVIIIFPLVILLISGLPLAWASKIPDYSALTVAIQAAYQARSDLLSNSTGTANIILEKMRFSAGAGRKLEEEFSKELGIDMENIRFTGKGTWTTTWYKKNIKNRYDINVPPPEEKDYERRPLLIQKNMRVAVDPEKGIYYDELHKEAYINRPPAQAGNPAHLLDHFDISRLYQFNSKELPDLLAVWAKAKVQPQCSEDQIGQTRCIKLEFSYERVNSSGKKRKSRLELWVAPEMSYSLVKAQLFGNKRSPGEEPVLIESYEATYQESAFKGIWLLKDVVIVDEQGPLHEKLTATFHNTKVGVEIPDETFTFEGLGVPPGTKVYDKSLGGQPLQYYYRSYPIGEIDNLAEEIKGQQEKSGSDEIRLNNESQPKEEAIVEEAEPDAISRIPAQITKSTNVKKHPWTLYCVLLITVVVILAVVFYRTILSTKEREQSL
jgi:hypothetical protein